MSLGGHLGHSELPSFPWLCSCPAPAWRGDLTAPTCPAKVRASLQGGEGSRGARRAVSGLHQLHPVPTYPTLHSAWSLVPMVRVDSMLPALQGPNKDPLQGLCLPCSPAWGCPMP